MNSYTAQADHHSATCFLNSLFLEWSGYEKIEDQGLKFIISLKGDEQISVPVTNYSPLGRHEYSDDFFLISPEGEAKKIDFLTLAKKIAEQFASDEKSVNEMMARVQNSTHNIATFLHNRNSDLETFFDSPLNFIQAEQAMLIGHAFHPTPKSRNEFTDEDITRFSPETRGHFQLHWFSVSQEILFQKTTLESANNWTHEFYQGPSLPPHHVPFPAHPWQKTFLLQNPAIKAHLESGNIVDLGPSGHEWSPTSSLRTLYSKASEYMVKFSMNVKLTNSMRHLLIHELERGLQVHQVFTHQLGKKFLSQHPQFEVIHEPVYAGIKDLSGKVIQESLIMGRLNPFKAESQSLVLATLTQDHPLVGKRNLINSCIAEYAELEKISLPVASLQWFTGFLEVGIRPLIKAQSDYGILLGAHQQNMIIELEKHFPKKSYFRDCHGTGYTPLGFDLFSPEIKEIVKENGNVLEPQMASQLFGYYLVINSVFNVISSIAKGSVTETELIEEFKSFLKKIVNEAPKDRSFLDYLLGQKYLMHKGNFLCSFKNINENTEQNPLSIYVEIPNPLFDGDRYVK